MKITFKPEFPITKEEKEILIEKRIKSIDDNKDYAIDLFATYYKDKPKENYKEWLVSDEDKKTKIVKFIIEQEDKAFTQYAMRTYKFNLNKQLRLIYELKVNQLKEYGIRK